MTTTTSESPATSPGARLPLRSLLILGLGVLVTVTAESLPAGMMPEMAAELEVDPLQIGLLVSVWAVTVIATSVPLARATAGVDRRLVVGISLALFAVANIATAFAPGYLFALAARVAAAAAHGIFWAVVIVYATSLLSPAVLGRGLAIVTAGGTAATVVGLPVATVLAQTWGWRTTFILLGAVALLVGVLVLLGMPRSVPVRATAERRSAYWRDPSLPALITLGVSAVLIAVAQFASFTYIRPYLEVSASIGAEWSSALLFVYGTSGMAGVVAAAFLADRFPRISLMAILALFVAVFATLTALSSLTTVVIVAVVAWGFGIGGLFPLLQTTLMRVSTERTRSLASAGIVVLFNVGIAVGPWFGGISGGATDPTATTAVSAAVMAVAAAVGSSGVVLAYGGCRRVDRDRHRPRPSTPAGADPPRRGRRRR